MSGPHAAKRRPAVRGGLSETDQHLAESVGFGAEAAAPWPETTEIWPKLTSVVRILSLLSINALTFTLRSNLGAGVND